MTVKELIAELIEYDMESEIEIVANNGMEYEIFSDVEVEEEHQISGKNTVRIHFQTDGVALIDEEKLMEMENKINELEELE